MTEQTTTLTDFTDSSINTGPPSPNNSEGEEDSNPEPCPHYEIERESEDWRSLKEEYSLVEPKCGHAISYLCDVTNSKIKPTTAKKYAIDLRFFINHLHEHNTILQNATIDDIDGYIKELARAGRSEGTLSGHRTSVINVCKHVALFRDCELDVRWDLIKEVIKPSEYQTTESLERTPLSREEASALFEELETFRDRLLVQAGIELGSRSSDLRTIELSDVDLADQRIELKNTKAGGRYTLPISEGLSLRLRHWINVERAALPHAEEDGYLFPSRQGGPLSGERLNAIIHNAAERAGIQEVIGTIPITERQQELMNTEKNERNFYRVTAHTLRHTFSNLLEEAGFDLEDRSAALDHTSTEVTRESYSHKESEYKDQMPAIFGDLEL